MYDDSEYLVLRINKGHRKGYPFDNFQEAFYQSNSGCRGMCSILNGKKPLSQ